ncbi:MAG: alpha/beta hydrolase [Acidimicrobiales bacterium]
MAPHFVEGADGLPIATWELGGAGTPLLVAHATGFHTGTLRALAGGLVGRHRVVGFDCRGHGRSGTPPLVRDAEGRMPSMGWDTFATDALAVVDALALDGAVGFGHSCGGALLLLAEERRPGTFSAIYAYEPVVLSPGSWAALAERGGDPSAAARRRRPAFASRDDALAHYAAKPPLSALRADVLADYVDGGFTEQPDGTVRLRCDPEVEAATFSMAPHADTWERLPEVACPVTFACGGTRADFGRAMTAPLAARVSHGRLEEHPDLGHLGPMEAPDQISTAVLAALGS